MKTLAFLLLTVSAPASPHILTWEPGEPAGTLTIVMASKDGGEFFEMARTPGSEMPLPVEPGEWMFSLSSITPAGIRSGYYFDRCPDVFDGEVSISIVIPWGNHRRPYVEPPQLLWLPPSTERIEIP